MLHIYILSKMAGIDGVIKIGHSICSICLYGNPLEGNIFLTIVSSFICETCVLT